jgi:hypothetical protein
MLSAVKIIMISPILLLSNMFCKNRLTKEMASPGTAIQDLQECDHFKALIQALTGDTDKSMKHLGQGSW